MWQDGIAVHSSNNTFRFINTSNSDNGFFFYNSNNNTLENITSMNNRVFSVYMIGYNNTIANYTHLDDRGSTIRFSSAKDCQLTNYRVTNSTFNAIEVMGSEDVNITHSYIGYNRTDWAFPAGIKLSNAINISLHNVTMNYSGIDMRGSSVQHFNTHTIGNDVTVNGRPVLYWKDRTSGTIPQDVGEIIIANCTNVNVFDHNVSNGGIGLIVANSSNIYVRDVTSNLNNYKNVVIWNTHHSIFENLYANQSDHFGIVVTDSINLTFLNTTTYNNYADAFEVYTSSRITLRNYTGIDAFGFYAEDCSYIEVLDSKPYGMELRWTDMSTVRNVTGGGILTYGNYNVIEECDCGQIFLWGDRGRVANCTSDGFNGFIFSSATNTSCLDCESTNSTSKGFTVWRSTKCDLINCTSKCNDIGILIDQSDNLRILNCNSNENNISINSVLSNSMTITDTLCNNNNVEGLNLTHSDFNKVQGLQAKNNPVGVRLYYADLNEIKGCQVQNNDYGVQLISSNRNDIFLNNIRGNTQYGMRIKTASENNSIYHNNFIDNELVSGNQAIDESANNQWNASGTGNHWSNWRTPDTELDGIVDNSFSLTGAAASKDYFPLTDIFEKPVILGTDNTSIYEDLPFSVPYSARDIDTQVSSLSWVLSTNASSWLTFSGSQVLSGTPLNEHVGIYWVNITVDDGYYSAFRNFSLNVLNTNDAPVINTTDITSCYDGQLYSVDYNATDIDPTKDTLTWGLETNATFLTMNSLTGLLEGTPTTSEIGLYSVVVNVTDGKGGLAQHAFDLEVLRSNFAPRINNTVKDFAFDEDTIDTSINLFYWFYDPDLNDTLTFRVEGNVNITVTIWDNGTVKLEPLPNWHGKEKLLFYHIGLPMHPVVLLFKYSILSKSIGWMCSNLDFGETSTETHP